MQGHQLECTSTIICTALIMDVKTICCHSFMISSFEYYLFHGNSYLEKSWFKETLAQGTLGSKKSLAWVKPWLEKTIGSMKGLTQVKSLLDEHPCLRKGLAWEKQFPFCRHCCKNMFILLKNAETTKTWTKEDGISLSHRHIRILERFYLQHPISFEEFNWFVLVFSGKCSVWHCVCGYT